MASLKGSALKGSSLKGSSLKGPSHFLAGRVGVEPQCFNKVKLISITQAFLEKALLPGSFFFGGGDPINQPQN